MVSLPWFVVASQQIDVLGVEQFEAEEEHDGLQGVVPAIYKVPDKNESCIWRVSSFLNKGVPIDKSFSTS
jgi:hypothetical protein